MRILLLCSSLNGLSQRVLLALRDDGHDVISQPVASPDAIARAVAAVGPELIICPFLKERVPDEVWRNYRTIIIHPGPKGDRGPSSLDWAITDAEPWWGVTALQAIDEMDAGPIWGERRFALPASPPRKSTLYNGDVADAAVSLAREVVAKAADPTFAPEPLDYRNPDVHGRLRPTMKQADRSFSWDDATEHIVRRIRAADGSPGVRTAVAGVPVAVFDAHPGSASPGKPGTIALRKHGAVLVRTGDGGVWIGHARRLTEQNGRPAVKLPAAMALGPVAASAPEALDPLEAVRSDGYREISYRRLGDIGVLRFDFYNGAMSTWQCHRLVTALRHAIAQDTKVLVLQSGEVFSNGIHLNVIEAHPNPPAEAWRNINAINEVCRRIITCTEQIVITAMGGPAGAGGVMLALGADRVLLRDGAVLNPHYATMGLFGSEYWTYVLPRRVGDEQARRLTTECQPVNAENAVRLGLADAIYPRDPAAFTASVLEYATELSTDRGLDKLIAEKRAARAADEQHRPLDTYRVCELAEMSRDIFDDRNGFAAARHAFVTKTPASGIDHRERIPTPRGAATKTTETTRPTGPTEESRLPRWQTFAAKLAGLQR